MPAPQVHHPSPKRKRDRPLPVPLVTTTLRPQSPTPRINAAPSAGAESPRNAVADQLRSMTLVPEAAISVLPLSPTDDLIIKKPRLNETKVEHGTESAQDAANTVSTSSNHGYKLNTVALTFKLDAVSEISEAIQSIQPRTSPDIASFAQATTFESPSVNAALHPHLSSSYRSHTQHQIFSPRPLTGRLSTSMSALTWKDSEITGHLADPVTDPDDDGTGLNGIGFKPTPAIAYARSQRRRQQLSEWKAREIREARAKRSERRRRDVGGAASVGTTVEKQVPLNEVDTVRRTVKFAV